MVNGQPYMINTDFRTGIAYAAGAASGTLDAASFFSIWQPEGAEPIPEENIQELFDGINAFFRRSEDEPKPNTDGPQPIAYDFLIDADIIISDFQKEYGIDLTTAEMHWWRFAALLDGLYSYSLQDRIRFRVGSMQGMSKEQRAERSKLRAKYRIQSKEEKAHEEWLQQIMLESANKGGE